MKKDTTPLAEAADLRRRAEARLREEAAKGAPGRTADDTQRLVHELQVHQINFHRNNIRSKLNPARLLSSIK